VQNIEKRLRDVQVVFSANDVIAGRGSIMYTTKVRPDNHRAFRSCVNTAVADDPEGG